MDMQYVLVKMDCVYKHQRVLKASGVSKRKKVNMLTQKKQHYKL